MIKLSMTNNRLSNEDILYAINQNKKLYNKYSDREKYYIGENVAITDQPDKEDYVPDNRIKVPYARKIAMTLKNYLFSRDPIYTAEDKDYIAILNKIFYVNDNSKKTSDIGLDLILHGIGYKLFYTDYLDGMHIPRYAVIDQREGVPVYSLDIEPKLIAFIRYYSVSTYTGGHNTVEHVEVYYSDSVFYYINKGGLTVEKPELKHSYQGFIPVVVYGDEYNVGVFDPVKTLIDAVDVIMSADVNEIQRFEMLYMIMIGDKMPDDPAEVRTILQRRIFELDPGAQLSFLEKHIDGAFNLNLLAIIQDMIYSLSGVPDFMSKEFAAQSGLALKFKLIGFENVAADVEQEFFKGERESFDLVNSLIYGSNNAQAFIIQNPDKAVEIKLNKNLPDNITEALDDAIKMQTLGISTETIYDYLPLIKDVGKEIEQAKAEKKQNFDDFQITQTNRITEPKETIPGDNNE